MAEQISVVLVHGLQGNGGQELIDGLAVEEFSADTDWPFWATAGPRWRSLQLRFPWHRMLRAQPSLGYNGARSERIFKGERFAGLKSLLHADFVERQRRKGFLLLSLIFFLSTTYGDIALEDFSLIPSRPRTFSVFRRASLVLTASVIATRSASRLPKACSAAIALKVLANRL